MFPSAKNGRWERIERKQNERISNPLRKHYYREVIKLEYEEALQTQLSALGGSEVM
jgi:hypothetical protein